METQLVPEEKLALLEKANQIADTTDCIQLLNGVIAWLAELNNAESGIVYLDKCDFFAYSKCKTVFTIQNKDLAVDLKYLFETKNEKDFEQILENYFSKWPDVSWWGVTRNAECVTSVLALFEAKDLQMSKVDFILKRVSSDINKMAIINQESSKNERLETLIDIMGQLQTTLDTNDLLRKIIKSGTRLLNAEACSLFLIDERTEELVLQLSSQQDSQIEQVRMPANQGIIGEVVVTGQTIQVDDAAHDTRHYIGFDQRSGFTTRSILAVPLVARSVDLGRDRGFSETRIIGGLEAINKKSGRFTPEDSELLRRLANEAATVLIVAQLYNDSNELLFDVVRAITAAIDAKDPYTVGHSERVSDFSVEIAREMGLSPEEIYHLRFGSLFHDVGKIGIPDAILTKPGKLTDEEYQKMKAHPVIGSKILGHVRLFEDELNVMVEHHERLDGKGYPNGLSDGQISRTGRIVAVADVFDAMTSDRPYREAIPVDHVFDYMKSKVNIEFDKECVDALIRAYRNRAILTQKERERLT
jgi:HD-GYP domain-containing protein (c-di-GMP phosphodiesterase class II)